MRESNGPRSARGIGRFPAILAAILAPLVIYLIVRAAMAGMGGAAALALASLPPADYREMVRGVSVSVQDPRIAVDRSTVALARKAAAAAPLVHPPYLILAQAEHQAGRLERAIALAEEARRRRPSHAMTRLILVTYYMEARRFPELLTELDMALRLNPEAQGPILPELTRLLADPAGRSALMPVLASAPKWRDDFYAAALSRGISSAGALAIYEGVRARRSEADVEPERRLYLQSLLAEGQDTTARGLWLKGLAPAEREMARIVFDGSFRGANAPPPFNWVLTDGDVGRAEIVREDRSAGLEVTYFGGREANLAEQRLALAPGRYTLAVSAQSETGVNGAGLAWRIICADQARPIVSVALSGLQPGARRYSGGFVVPPGCRGQQLILRAIPGDISTTVEAQVRSVEIRPNA